MWLSIPNAQNTILPWVQETSTTKHISSVVWVRSYGSVPSVINVCEIRYSCMFKHRIWVVCMCAEGFYLVWYKIRPVIGPTPAINYFGIHRCLLPYEKKHWYDHDVIMVFFLASGSYTHMLVTDKRSGYRAVMNTPFLTFNNTCLELHYSFMGSVNSTLHIKSLSENQHVRSEKHWLCRWFSSTRHWVTV